MLRACMIDGFGWFAEASYRRSWLFFDNVDYVFAHRSAWPGYPPPWAASSKDFRLSQPELTPAHLESLAEQGRAACDADFRALVANRVPGKDARNAVDVVSLDEDLRPVRAQLGIALEPGFALAFLAAKLLAAAEASGAVPIFGRPYAQAILARVASVNRAPAAQESSSLLSARGSSRLVTVATELSCGFVTDDHLLAVPFERLLSFKEKHTSLMEREQVHLIDVAQQIENIPDGPEFDARLRRLRLEAIKRKQELEQERRDAWLGFGFDLGTKALASGGVVAAIEGALAVLHTGAAGGLGSAAAAAVAGLGVAAAGALHTRWDLFRKRGGSLAYLFEAEAALGHPSP